MMDVWQVLVFVGNLQVAMFRPTKKLDCTGPVVWIARVDRVCVLDHAVNVHVTMVG